ncbi:hypothetical protein [Aquimarina algicola]|uniref:WG repeat-containing protein n=1 Tax=Aquimarina algicola TaxID=2589995 RepID=A0A504J4X2_9FLAO|nr:hypothetical protein [Aquimarina algicola]TPN85857.1 hypothetical protein FHK87_11265 [Aquimarina algicola]
MKHISKYLLIVLFLLACKIENKNKSSLIAETKEAITQQKDTIKIKSAIGKSYNQYLHEIEEFKKYDNHGSWSIYDNFGNENQDFKEYGLATLDIFERNRKEGTSIKKGIKFIVLLNSNIVIDYIDVEDLTISENLILYSDGVQLNGKIDKELFAFAPYIEEDEEIITEVNKVYRADKETGKIFEIPTDGISIISDY